MKKYFLFVPLAVLLLLSSCSGLRIEKRHYSGGYYVDFTRDVKSSSSISDTGKEDAISAQDVAQAHSETPASALQQPESPAVNSQGRLITSTEETGVVIAPANETNAESKVEQQNDAARVIRVSSTPEPLAEGDTELILLFILALLLPPVAVYLKQGLSTLFWIDLICALFGCGFFFMPYFGGLFLAAVIIAILVVFDVL